MSSVILHPASWQALGTNLPLSTRAQDDEAADRVCVVGYSVEHSTDVRALCVKKRAAGMTFAAIAADLDMRLSTVKTIVKRASERGQQSGSMPSSCATHAKIAA